MLQLQENGLGVEKGVPTLLVAASSIENVYAIEVFSVLMSVGFSTSTWFITLIDWLNVDWWFELVIDRLIDWLIVQSIDLLVPRLIIDWLIDWLGVNLTSLILFVASLTMQILQAPIEIVIGVSYGLATGFLFWYFPHNVHVSHSL